MQILRGHRRVGPPAGSSLQDLCTDHVHQQVHHTVGIAPLVVVPRHDLEEALLALEVVLQGRLGVVDGGVHVVDEVAGHQLLIGEGQNTLHVSLSGFLHQCVNLFDGGVLLSSEGQVDHRDVRCGHAEGHTGQLALGAGQHLAHCLGGSGRAGNNIARRSTSSTPVLGGDTIHGLLGGGVGVDGGHQTLLDSDALLQQHMDDGRQAVGGAGGVGHHVVVRLVVLRVVHATDQGLQVTLSRGRDDDLLGARLDVSGGLLSLHKETSRLNHIFHAHVLPRQGLGSLTAGLDALDLVAVHNQLVLLPNLHVVLEATVHRVILHLVGEVLRICGHIHHANHIQLGSKQVLVANGLEDHATNASESVDANLRGHNCKMTSEGHS
mmetsp:Transcript_50682/g.83391  ORF Transcript_50682/g.83391 Transcript_50682/m.83391 type:complete len:379 (-) Transcript_50682:25-1161(-)